MKKAVSHLVNCQPEGCSPTGRKRTWTRGSRLAWLAVALVAASTITRPMQAQDLVITEVMSSSADTLNGEPLPPDGDGPDWWELTNYGSNALNLTGYSFSDQATNRALAGVLDGVILGAGQSLILSKTNRFVHLVEQFENWWWGDCRAAPDPMPQIILHDGAGLGSTGDQVWLFDAADQVVDMVFFGVAQPGRTFTLNPDNGSFGSISGPASPGTYRSCTADDYGSPGWAPPPLPAIFLIHPNSQEVCVGGMVLLTAKATGLPRPTYQWYHNGVPLGETTRQLVIDPFQSDQAGDYWVVACNGHTTATSEVARVEAIFDDVPPSLIQSPESLLAFPHQTARFQLQVLGCPMPVVFWMTNGVLVEGVHSSTLAIPPTSLTSNLTPQQWKISFVASNAYGVAIAPHPVSLVIDQIPNLRVTELMSAPSNSVTTEFKDWIELTNLGDHTVSIKGYRLSDYLDFDTAFQITNDVALYPGESVILVDRMSRQGFRDWWGEDQLPHQLKVITWMGFGFRADGTEPVVLWNAAATDDFDWVLATSSVQPFEGISLLRDEFDFLAVDSELGYDGTIQSVDGNNYGSPGMYHPVILDFRPAEIIQAENPELHFVYPGRASAEANPLRREAEIRFWGMEGCTYRLLTALNPGAGIAWTPMPGTVTASAPVESFQVILDDAASSQWFKIEEVGP